MSYATQLAKFHKYVSKA